VLLEPSLEAKTILERLLRQWVASTTAKPAKKNNTKRWCSFWKTIDLSLVISDAKTTKWLGNPICKVLRSIEVSLKRSDSKSEIRIMSSTWVCYIRWRAIPSRSFLWAEKSSKDWG
jgi:hypothetical protein